MHFFDFTTILQAIGARMQIAEEIDLLQELFEKEREKIVNEIIIQLGNRFLEKEGG